jgi:hypothetical protein
MYDGGMRQLIAILSLGLLLSPAVALAQDAGAPPPPRATPTAQQRALMEQARTQMQQIHAQARTQMLASLSPAHRTAVANVIGQLATSPNPNPALAARQIDAVLTQAEGQSILRTHQAAKTQMQTLHSQMRAQFESSLTPDERAQMEAHRAQFAQSHPGGMAGRPSSTDPGAVLLRALGPEHEGGMHGPGGSGGMGGPPRG